VPRAKFSDLDAALAAMLGPVVQFCLENGIRFKSAQELVKRAFVQEARQAILRASDTESVSRISLATGVQRPEVQRLIEGRSAGSESNDILNRVIGAWRNSKRFKDRGGAPRRLTHAGTNSDFAALVASVSKEVGHYPVLFELERMKAISYHGDLVQLEVQEYVPEANLSKSLAILSEDISDLISAVEANVSKRHPDPSLHLRTVYDNVPPAALPEIRRALLAKGAELHRELSAYLAKFDRDVTPNPNDSGGRARVSVTSFANAAEIEPVKPIAPRKRGRKKWTP
jgi:hypothetical protein